MTVFRTKIDIVDGVILGTLSADSTDVSLPLEATWRLNMLKNTAPFRTWFARKPWIRYTWMRHSASAPSIPVTTRPPGGNRAKQTFMKTARRPASLMLTGAMIRGVVLKLKEMLSYRRTRVPLDSSVLGDHPGEVRLVRSVKLPETKASQ